MPIAASCGGWDASPNARSRVGNGKPTLSKGCGLFWGREPPGLAPGHAMTCGRAWGSASPGWVLLLSPGCEGPAGAVCWRAVPALQLCGCHSSSQSKLGCCEDQGCGLSAAPDPKTAPGDTRSTRVCGAVGQHSPHAFAILMPAVMPPAHCCKQRVGPRGFSLRKDVLGFYHFHFSRTRQFPEPDGLGLTTVFISRQMLSAQT